MTIVAEQRIVKGPLGSDLERRITPLLEELLRQHELPGVALGVVVDGEMVLAMGLGVSSRRTGEPVLPTTLFHMASISKPFVAAAVMQLVERGLVVLDEPMARYLPQFRLADERYRQITVRQVLNHTSGMPDVKDYRWHSPEYDDQALIRYVRSLAPLRLLSAPGERFAYSNMAFECLGAMVAIVAGQTFDDYVAESILAPCGMAGSTFLKPPSLPRNWAAPHPRTLTDREWEGYPYHRAHGPSSTLHSSAMDMCRWAVANLNRGRIAGQRILQPDSYDLLWTRGTTPEGLCPVGLSWFLDEYRGEKIVWHGGGDTGFESYLVLVPERGAAVVIMSNLLPARVGEAGDAVLDLLLGHEPEPIRPLLMLKVRRTLAEGGVEAAAAEWSELASREAEWNTMPIQRGMMMNAVALDWPEEAALLARFCLRTLPAEEVDDAVQDLEGYGLGAADAALAALLARE